MAEAAVGEAPAALSSAQLATRHGLRVAGARPPLPEYTRQVWSYRHFISAFADAKHAATFSATRLGRLWQVLTPLVNAAVYFLVFGVVLNTRADINNFVGYLSAGVFLFGFTQHVVLTGMRSVSDHLGLIRSLHFPRACLPIAATLSELKQLIASVGVLMVIELLTGEPLTLGWVLIVPVLVLQAAFSAGLAMAMARVAARVGDLKQLMPFVLRTWMYASGVFYSVTKFTAHLPAPVAKAMAANPMVVYIDLAREALLESPPPPGYSTPQLWLLAVGWAALIGAGGFLYFWRGEPEYGRG